MAWVNNLHSQIDNLNDKIIDKWHIYLIIMCVIVLFVAVKKLFDLFSYERHKDDDFEDTNTWYNKKNSMPVTNLERHRELLMGGSDTDQSNRS